MMKNKILNWYWIYYSIFHIQILHFCIQIFLVIFLIYKIFTF